MSKASFELGSCSVDGRNGVEEPIVVLEIERHDGWMLLVGRNVGGRWGNVVAARGWKE